VVIFLGYFIQDTILLRVCVCYMIPVEGISQLMSFENITSIAYSNPIRFSYADQKTKPLTRNNIRNVKTSRTSNIAALERARAANNERVQTNSLPAGNQKSEPGTRNRAAVERARQ